MNVAPNFSQATPEADIRADPVEVFGLRCNARARLYATGEIDLQTAVDELQESAELNGLVAAIGQDAVQAIMAAAFSAVQVAEKPAPLPDDQYEGLGSTFAEACRKADATWHPQHIRPARLERLRLLMGDDVSIERAWHELNERAPGTVPLATLHAAEYLAFQQDDLQRLKNWLAPRSPEEVAAIRKHLSK
jgi:hypothetical protein